MLPPHFPSPGQPGGPPHLRPSYTVHVSATEPQQIGTTANEGPTWITSTGFRLQDLLSRLYDIPPERIDFHQPSLADQRFDVAMRLPARESESSMHLRIVHALEKQLGISIRSVAQTEDVYAVTIADPKKLPLQAKPALGGFSSTSTEFTVPTDAGSTKDQRVLAQLMKQGLEERRKQSGIALDSIDMEGSVDELCRMLETGVQRPVLDHTGLQGVLKMTVRRDGLDRDHFFQKLDADFGLAITPDKAEVKRVLVKAQPPRR